MPEPKKFRERRKILPPTLKRIRLTTDFWLVGLAFLLVTVSLILGWPRPGEKLRGFVDPFSFIIIGIVLPLLWVTGRNAKRWERSILASVIAIPIAASIMVPLLYVVPIHVVGNSYGGLLDELKHFDGSFRSGGIKVDLKEDWSGLNTNQRHEILMDYLGKSKDVDIFELDGPWMEQAIKSGGLLSLDLFYDRDMSDKPFRVAALDVARDSKTRNLFGIPLYLDVGLIFYRKDLLGELPNPATLDDLTNAISESFAQTNKKGLAGFIFQSAEYEGLNALFFEVLSSENVNIVRNHGRVHINSGSAISVIKKLHDLIYEHGIVPPSVLVFHEEESRKLFTLGRAGALRNWPYVLHQWESMGIPLEAIGITSFPNPVLGGWYLGIAKESKHPEKAWKVIQYLTGIQRIRATHPIASRRRIPSFTNLLSELQSDFPFMSNVEQALRRAKARPRLRNYHSFSKSLSSALFKVLSDGNATEETIKVALDQVQLQLK